MSEREQGIVDRALRGDAAALRALVDLLTPSIQARVVKALSRRRAPGRSARQEVEDMTQDVFVSLLENDARALRAWNPGRGLDLRGFVGFLAERQVACILRTGRRSPWTEDPTPDEDMPEPDALVDAGPESRIASREMLEALLDRLRCELSPIGMHLFYALVVEKRPIDELAREMKMTPGALYAWRSRLKKIVNELARQLEEQDGRGPRAASRA